MADTTIIIPDIHAGYVQSRVNDLARRLPDWLNTSPMPDLIFIGDVLDLWRATPEDALGAAQPLLSVVQDFLKAGGSVRYLLGNHDYHLLPDLNAGRAIAGLLPKGIEYHHRYLMLNHQGKRVLICHGDDYDFLYLPLVKIDPLIPGHPLTPDSVYQFYEEVFGMNKNLIGGYDKEGLRGLLIAWIKERFFDQPLFLRAPGSAPSQFSLVGELTLAATQNTPVFHPGLGLAQDFLNGATTAAQSFSGFSLQDWLTGFHGASDLDAVSQHTPLAQSWGITNFDPFDHQDPIAMFQPYDYLIVGHFHDPRQTPDLPVTDSGSWVTDPNRVLISGTYVEVTGGKVRLHFTDTGEIKETAL